jgi:hypothetical protein
MSQLKKKTHPTFLFFPCTALGKAPLHTTKLAGNNLANVAFLEVFVRL